MLNVFYTDYYLPDNNVTFDKILEVQDDFTLAKGCSSMQECYESIREETKQDKITVGNKEDGIEVFTELFENFLKNTGIDKEKIKILVSTDPIPLNSVVKDNFSIPHYLIGKYDLHKAAMGIVQQQCTGSVLSMALMDGLLKQGEYGVILSSNYINEMKNRNLGFTFMGDGAGLMVVGKGIGKWKIVSKLTSSSGMNTVKKYNGEQVENTSRLGIIKKGVSLIEQVLSDNALESKDLYQFIPQNVNQFIYSNFYARFLGIEEEKVYFDNMAFGGHIGDVDLIRNLTDFTNNNEIPDKSYVMLYGLGSNGLDMSYGVILLQYGGNRGAL